jgi:hypothetical protein
MSKNTEFAEKLAEQVVHAAEMRSARTDGYIKREILREVWQEHIDELGVEMECISAKFPDNPDLQRRLAEGANEIFCNASAAVEAFLASRRCAAEQQRDDPP